MFFEINGILGPGPVAPPTPAGRVVLSTLSSGFSEMSSPPAMGLAYVGSGLEIYQLGGRPYPVAAGQFLIVPHGHSGEAEIGRSADGAALGLCISLPNDFEVRCAALDQPMVFPAACSILGRTLADTHRHVRRKRSEGKIVARSLLPKLGQDVERLLEDTVRTLEGMDAMKPSTRYEILRRLNTARAYLHDVTDHAVELAELSRIAGMSRFQLLRSFRDAFGAPPAAYHRRWRLQLAKAAVDRRQLSCGEAAQRYGFADGSSFSHAYRRAFGTSPSRS
jgi:AraC-like DNA-binding protein